ncbi:MAG: hypothetical protein RLZZ546_3334 [Bacteroidota bacterium]
MVLVCSFKSNAQCSLNIPSTNGYTVHITPTITSITVTPNGCGTGFCLCGYVYRYTISYNITFSGTNIPSSLWTMQGVVSDNNSTGSFNLPNNGGTGSVMSANQSTGLTNCSTVNYSYFNPCVNIIIQGHGISHQTIPVTCHCTTVPIELIEFTGVLKMIKYY